MGNVPSGEQVRGTSLLCFPSCPCRAPGIKHLRLGPCASSLRQSLEASAGDFVQESELQSRTRAQPCRQCKRCLPVQGELSILTSAGSWASFCSCFSLFISLAGAESFRLAGRTMLSVPRALAALAFAISRSSLLSLSLRCSGERLRERLRERLLHPRYTSG